MLEHCINIALLCKENEEDQWGTVFEDFARKIEMGEIESVKREIRDIYKGAGSFNDLVLHKNGIPLLSENDDLDKLRRQLCQETR